MLLTPRAAASASASPLVFPVKRIPFGRQGRQIPILLQNEAGPCPLLAVANILLLQRQLDVDPQYTNVPLIDILTGIANRVLEVTEANAEKAAATVAAAAAAATAAAAAGGGDGGCADTVIGERAAANHVAYQVDEIIHLLPRLQHGMDVNVRFTDVAAFEPTAELSVFDALGIRLFHGWVVEEEEEEEGREGGVLARVVGGMTYNEITGKLVAMKEGGREGGGREETGLGSRSSSKQQPSTSSSSSTSTASSSLPPSSATTTSLLLLEDFLLHTPGQLTSHGLSLLHSTVRENELCGLFHHNHFSVLLKKGGKLYLLVTDGGYKDEAQVVWARLEGVSGAGELVDGLFRPVVRGGEGGGGGGSFSSDDRSSAAVGTAVAVSLQEQEEAETRLIEQVMAISLLDVDRGGGRGGGRREELKEEERRNEGGLCLDRAYTETELAEMRQLERAFQYARLQKEEKRHEPRGRREGGQQRGVRRGAASGTEMGRRSRRGGSKECTVQ